MTTVDVLLVEDDANEEDLALRGLRRARAGLRIRVARDGQQALDELLREGADLPSLVILDIGLPRLSGIEVLERLRADSRTRELPVVVFTSSDASRDRTACERLGANAFVSKPIDPHAYMRALQRLVTDWVK